MASEVIGKVAEVVMDGNTVTTILNNINNLYSSAVTQLITYTIGMMAFVGVILPVVISLLQSRQLKADQANLTQKMETAIENAKVALSEQIKLELQAEMASYERRITEIRDALTKNIQRAEDRVNAKTHHLQANSFLEKNLFMDALEDCAYAAEGYASSGDERNMQAILDNVAGRILPRLNRSHFDDSTNAEEKLQTILKAIEPLDQNDRYRRDKDKLNEAMKSAKARPATASA